MNNQKKIGIVRRILRDGYGYVESRDSQRQYLFSFGSIPNYRGETAKELNLHPGSEVEFETQGERVVSLNIVLIAT